MTCSTPLCIRGAPQITAAPIRRLIKYLRKTGVGDEDIANDLGVPTELIAAILRRQTINLYAADRMVCAMGFCPVEVWPEWGQLADEEEIA